MNTIRLRSSSYGLVISESQFLFVQFCNPSHKNRGGIKYNENSQLHIKDVYKDLQKAKNVYTNVGVGF